MMEYGYYCPHGLRLLTDVEQESIDLLREEKEMHIWELNKEQLKKLRSEIRVGSYYGSDYENSFGIDADEICKYSEGYLNYIDEIGCEDTQETFAEYCMQ